MGKLQERIKEIDLGLDAVNDTMVAKVSEIIEKMMKEFPYHDQIAIEMGWEAGHRPTNKEIFEVLQRTSRNREKWFWEWLK